MVQAKLTTKMEDDLLNAETWFFETYEKNEKTSEKIQVLILYKLYELERKLDAVTDHTKMHWTN